MNFLILAFILSLLTTLWLIRYQHLHEKISSDDDLSGPQKFHEHIVPRIGGVAIIIAIFICTFVATIFFSPNKGYTLLQLTACALPSFCVGLAEDLTKKINIKTRLAGTILSAIFAGYFLNAWITQIQVPAIDFILNIKIVAILFTLIAITGLANAYNIIDGFNGLASMVAMISLLAIGYVAFKVNDLALTSACLITIGAIAGFFIWNYPRGLIFLGDGGAYLIGFLIATLSILLVNRNPSVSPWFALLVNAYPIFETLFTIWRRKVHQGRNPGLPDGAHFHSLIYRRLIRWAKVHATEDTISYTRNSKTSPYLWFLSSLAALPAIIWWDSTLVLQCFAILFCVSYVWIYKAVVNFRTPEILKIFK